MELIDRQDAITAIDDMLMEDEQYKVWLKLSIKNIKPVDAIPVEHVKKMIESVKSLPNADYSLKYFAVNVMDALISGWRVEEKRNEK